VIDFDRDLAELAEKKNGRRRSEVKLDDNGQGGETAYLIQSRLSPLEIVGSGAHRG
jgi:hypothetical protein